MSEERISFWCDGQPYTPRTPVLWFMSLAWAETYVPGPGEKMRECECRWCEHSFKVPDRVQAFCCSQRCADLFRARSRNRDPEPRKWPGRKDGLAA
jgi:hypothetical protein